MFCGKTTWTGLLLSLQGPGTGRGWTSVWLPAARHGAISTASTWAVYQGNGERHTADSGSTVCDSVNQQRGSFPEVIRWLIIYGNGQKISRSGQRLSASLSWFILPWLYSNLLSFISVFANSLVWGKHINHYPLLLRQCAANIPDS